MEEKKKIDPEIQRDAKIMIDAMFDRKIFKDEITRDDMQCFEDVLALLLQYNSETTRRLIEFSEKYKKFQPPL